MKELDKVLDTAPTSGAVMQMVELRIQNLLAFSELQSYNDNGKFLYRHPLICHKSERSELESLLKNDPQEFLRRHKCVLDNIRRYEAKLKNPVFADKHENFRALLQRHRDKELLFKTILQSIKS